MKRVFAILVALMLVCSMAVTVFATQTVGTESATTGTVTISNASIGETYQGFRIFNATVARSDNNTAADPTDDTSTAINYTWAGTGSMPANSYFTEDASGNITATPAAGTGGVLSSEAIALLKSWVGADNSTYSFPATAATVATDTTMKFAGLDYGYWYFTSTLGTIVTINSTNPNVTVTDKNTAPTINKTVKEDRLDQYGKQNDAEYGQTVEFRTTINAYRGAENYILYDLMDPALVLDINSITVKVNDGNATQPVNATATGGGTNWTATTGGTYPNGSDPATTATFNIVFSQSFLNTLHDSDSIIIEYNATLSDTAAINSALPNKTILTYGNASKTAESETRTYTWGAQIYKYTGTLGSGETALQGAEFILVRHATEEVSGTPTQGNYFAQFDANGKLTGRSAFVPSTTLSDAELLTIDSATLETTYGATILTTGANGQINLSGLDEGTYYIVETKAPDGYNKLTSNRTLTITSSGPNADLSAPLTSGTSGVTTINVENNAGTVLPSTGGEGTKWIYITGGILAAGALIALVIIRKVKED